ncbi:Chymotrypsin-elastase inhibitor ixodidin [Pseudolycoriella hygida]|uniref:Chymotrypsin-elastase inhibitor ixodidin n=1 Tax=Pseudolycoriella hygida TaxID=35572 RepID=A0A9Q0NEU8_9DIPT|nr:Chymotrypsin-elastase inhibitor ixodidin [Pseudolycoriella hygida]
MKLILISLLVLTISLVDSAFVPTVPSLSDDDFFNEEDCAPNETFRDCGNHPICDRTCDNITDPYLTCPPICVRRCVCDSGFVRDGNGDCIAERECYNK